ncbi:rCG63355 [Rattus norvegicus]|uniref:RCG63355 n=1 Tax=Rattus norvegicus TaxID=10116 RepID=A6IIH1_RAT|nr:rCG63355 [Rattus norvegicus]
MNLSRVPAAEPAASCRGDPESRAPRHPPARPPVPRMRSPAPDALTPRTKGAAAIEPGVGDRCLPELCGHRTAAPQLRAPSAGGGRGGGGGESGHRPAVPPPCRLPAAPASG